MGADHAEDEECGEARVGEADHGRSRPGAAAAQVLERAQYLPPVEKADRDQVEQVDQEAEVGERLQELGVDRLADDPERRGADGAQHRPGERDPGQPPRRQLLRPERHERSEEGHEDRPVRVQAQPPRLDEVAELVDQDQGDEADRDAPAPDQGVAADSDEDAAELREREAVLGGRPDSDHDRRHEPLPQLAPVRAWMDRLVVAGDLGRLHDLTVAPQVGSGTDRRSPSRPRCLTVEACQRAGSGPRVGEPRPIHSSPPS